MNRYEIGGICVQMSTTDAKKWNAGDLSNGLDQRVLIEMPDQYEQPSRLSCGEVRLGEPQLVKAGRTVRLADASQEVRDQMDGFPANQIN